MGGSKKLETIFRSPCNKHPSMSGSILGPCIYMETPIWSFVFHVGLHILPRQAVQGMNGSR